MTSSRRRAIRAAVFTSLLAAATPLAPVRALAATPSAEDLASARALVHTGRELRKSGDLRGALEKFQAAWSLAQTPVTGIEVARSELELHQLVEAREASLAIGRLPVESDETHLSVDARAEAASMAQDLAPRIPSILVRVHGASGATVVIDGARVPPAAADEPRLVNPGHHTIEAQAAGGPLAKAEVDVAEGEHKTLDMNVEGPPPLPPLPPTSATATTAAPPPPTARPPVLPPPDSGHPPPPRRNTLAIVGFGVAGAGIAIGTLTGIAAIAKKSSIDGVCVDSRCPPEAWDDLDAARTMGTISTIAFGVGGAGLLLGIYAIVTHDGASSASLPASGARIVPLVGAGSVGIHGAF